MHSLLLQRTQLSLSGEGLSLCKTKRPPLRRGVFLWENLKKGGMMKNPEVKPEISQHIKDRLSNNPDIVGTMGVGKYPLQAAVVFDRTPGRWVRAYVQRVGEAPDVIGASGPTLRDTTYLLKTLFHLKPERVSPEVSAQLNASRVRTAATGKVRTSDYVD